MSPCPGVVIFHPFPQEEEPPPIQPGPLAEGGEGPSVAQGSFISWTFLSFFRGRRGNGQDPNQGNPGRGGHSARYLMGLLILFNFCYLEVIVVEAVAGLARGGGKAVVPHLVATSTTTLGMGATTATILLPTGPPLHPALALPVWVMLTPARPRLVAMAIVVAGVAGVAGAEGR